MPIFSQVDSRKLHPRKLLGDWPNAPWGHLILNENCLVRQLLKEVHPVHQLDYVQWYNLLQWLQVALHIIPDPQPTQLLPNQGKQLITFVKIFVNNPLLQ